MTQLTHWVPERWRETLANLRDDVHDIVERWMPGGHGTSSGRVRVRYPNQEEEAVERSPQSWLHPTSPAIDLHETNDEIVVIADLPGLEPDDFGVETSGERLVIWGEKKGESSGEGRDYRYHERHYGAFARAVPLMCEVDAGKAQAVYRHGVLRVTLPKTESAKAKRTQIQVHG